MMDRNYTFSAAEPADADDILVLYQNLIGTPGCTWNSEYPTKEFIDSDIKLHSLYILKNQQGQIIATASCGGERELDDLQWDMQNPCELARVAVAPSLHHQGIGSYLLKQVIAAVKARGFDGICMLVATSNSAALGLYEKHGFTRCGKIRRYGFNFFRYQIALETIIKT